MALTDGATLRNIVDRCADVPGYHSVELKAQVVRTLDGIFLNFFTLSHFSMTSDLRDMATHFGLER